MSGTVLRIVVLSCCGWAAIFTASSWAEEPVFPREWLLPGGVTYQLRGRLDTDALWATQSSKNEADFGELQDVVGLRRARIGIEGDLPNDCSYVAEIDLAGGDPQIRDFYIAHQLAIGGNERYGHFREPFSLEGDTSANYFAFMERSPANTLDPARNWGIGLYELRPTADTAFSMGGFYSGTDTSDFAAGDGSTAGVTAKLTAAPINEHDGRRLLHFGLAAAQRIPLTGIILINDGPQSNLLEFNDTPSSVFIPTITIPADFQEILNCQIAVARGSWWSQAEWYGTFIDQTDGPTVFYHGSHVDVGVFLTGEHREYQASTGVFGPVKVNRPVFNCRGSYGRELGPGAWELVARFAWADFYDFDAPTNNGQVQGVQLPEGTLGANWYLTDHTRLMFNYTYAAPIEPTEGQSSASVLGTRLGVFW